MNTHQLRAIKALERLISDDTYRARMAFAGLTPEEMQKEHGRSGQTRAEILAGYEKRDAEILETIEWVKAQNSK